CSTATTGRRSSSRSPRSGACAARARSIATMSGTIVRFTLRVPAPFELRLAALSHGWFDLPPFRWDEERGALGVALDLGPAGRALPADVAIAQRRDGALQVELRTARRPLPAQIERARRAVGSMLRLDQDLRAFWALCARDVRLRWAAARGAGRLLRGASVFEDLLKLLFTTNCSWAATRKMTERTVAALGERTPSGARTFPSPARCAEQPESFWRTEVRAGYRAAACAALADAFAAGRLADAWFTDPEVPADELRRRLRAIRGFGPYAAGQAM